jgi:WD40 domain-containing protein
MTSPAKFFSFETTRSLRRAPAHAALRDIAAALLLVLGAALPAVAQGGPSSQASRGSQADGVPLLALDPEGHNRWIVELLRYSYQNQLILFSHDKTIRFWSLDTSEPLRVLRPPIDRGDAGRLCAGAISPDETLLAIGGYSALRDARDCRIMLLSLPEGQLIRTLAGHTGPIRALAFSPDGSLLASAGDDAVIRLHNPKTGKLLLNLVGHADRVYALCTRWPGIRTAHDYSAARGTTRGGSGQPADSRCSYSRGTRAASSQPIGARTESCWPPAPGTAASACGMPTAACGAFGRTSTITSRALRFRPIHSGCCTAGAVGTRRSMVRAFWT